MNIVSGNMFDNGFDRIVVTVNCVGIAGKGNALEFKHRFPEGYATYQHLCRTRQIVPGDTVSLSTAPVILAFTKDHWRNPSQESWILDVLNGLKVHSLHQPDKTIGMPPPGAGLGGLDPTWVLKQAQEILDDCPNVYYHLPE